LERERHSNKLFLLIAILLCSVLVALRSELPNRDFPVYLANYETPSLWHLGVEKGYQILVLSGKTIAVNAELFFAIISITALIFKLNLYYKLSNCFPTLFIFYFAFFFWLHEMTQLRLAISQPFILYATILMNEKKNIIDDNNRYFNSQLKFLRTSSTTFDPKNSNNLSTTFNNNHSLPHTLQRERTNY
jgi:hypothetical protein